MQPNDKIGIALSGGGTRGAFHPGFLKGLDPIKSQITSLAGTSIGSVVGVFYCAGYAPDEIFRLFKEQSIFKLLSILPTSKGLMELKGMKKLLKQKIPTDFSELAIPLKVVTTNLSTDEEMVIGSGDLHEAVVASCSIPIIFNAVTINDHECIDGGLMNNMPANTIKEEVDQVIGVHVNKYSLPDRGNSIQMMADKIFSLVIRQNVIRSKVHCDYFVEPKLTYSNVLDFGKIDEFFARGQEVGSDFVKNPDAFKL